MNIAQLLVSSAQDQPENTAWLYGTRQATYQEFAARVSYLAGFLRSLGLASGECIVLYLPNRPELIDMLWAAWWSGMVAVPINWHLHADEVRYILADSRARAVLVDAQTADAVRHSVKSPLVLHADRLFNDTAVKPLTMPIEAEPNDPAWLFYTSGTTGRPKGATLSHRNLLAMTLNYYADVDPIAPGSRFAHAAPLTHGSGLYLLPAVGRAATNVIDNSPRFDAANFVSLLTAQRITHISFLAPTMLMRLIDSDALRELDLTDLRSIVVGGAPLYCADLERAIDVFGPILTQIYGQGEAPMTITVMPATALTTRAGRKKAMAGSCGRAFVGVEVKVVDENGKTALPGAAGEICVRGDVVMGRYWNKEQASTAALRHGWLHTGDIGHFDEQRFLFLTDRANDVIITGGSNVYPREIEEVLLTHPGVREVAVIGIPDREWGQSIRAYVVEEVAGNLQTHTLIEHVRQHLASFKKPKSIVFVDELPKNAAGKVLKLKLTELNENCDEGAYFSGTDRGITGQ